MDSRVGKHPGIEVAGLRRGRGGGNIFDEV